LTDIDAGDLDQVAVGDVYRSIPRPTSIWCRRPGLEARSALPAGNFNNRVLIDACIPYDMKLKGTFPTTVDVSAIYA